MDLSDGLELLGEAAGLIVKDPDGGELECSDLLVLALGLGALTVVGTSVYLCKDKIPEIIRAAKEKKPSSEEEKLQELLKKYANT